MAPKKSKTKQTSKTKSSEKCNFNNRGYCKQKDECENKHFDLVCDNFDCDENECEKRHPNPCRFGPRCQFNRKNECLYLHVTSAPDDGRIEALNQNFNTQIEDLKRELSKMQKNLNNKDAEIKVLNEKYATLEKQTNDTQDLRKDLESKNAQINGLEMRLEELEKDQKTQKKQQDKKIRDLDNLCKVKNRKEIDSDH